MKLGMATYWIIGFMNGVAAEESTATYVKFTDCNSDAVMNAIEAACAENPAQSLAEVTKLVRDRLIGRPGK